MKHTNIFFSTKWTWIWVSMLMIGLSDIGSLYGQMSVSGKELRDECGNRIILRGVNVMTLYWDGYGGQAGDWSNAGKYTFQQVEQTGANAARIFWHHTHGSEGWSIPASAFEATIRNCTDQGMIAIPSLWEATGPEPVSKFNEIVDFWVRPEIVAIINQYKDKFILNIANEWNAESDANIRTHYTNAINRIRAAGIDVPLMIDGGRRWSQDEDAIYNNAAYLLDQDPQRDIIFSMHMYDPIDWIYEPKGTTARLKSIMDEIDNMGIYFTWGEFSRIGHNNQAVAWDYLTDYAQTKQQGWLAWTWWCCSGEGDSQTIARNKVYGDWLHSPWSSSIVNKISSQSTRICSGGGPTGSVIQAEDHSSESGTSFSTGNSGYTGSGYVDYGGNGSWAEWTINLSGTSADLVFRYANGSGDNRSCDLIINGNNAGSVDFPDTGGWASWSTTSFNGAGVSNGSNTIRLVANNSFNGGPNFDRIDITISSGGDTQAPTVPTGLFAFSITETSFILNWSPSTDNVSVEGYEVFQDGVSIGTSTDEDKTVSGLTAGTTYAMTVRARDAAGNWSAQSSALNVTTASSGGSTTVSVKISGSADDAEETISGGTMDLVSNDLDIRNTDICAMRFVLNVPQGASITSANIDFVSKGASSGSNTFTFKGQVSDDASAFTTAGGNLSSRSQTGASVTWNPGSWTDGQTYTTPDLAPVIQEVVNRSGWSSGNNMVIFVSASTSSKRAARTFDFNGNDSQAPELSVTFTTPGAGARNAAATGNKWMINNEATSNISVYPNPSTAGVITILSPELSKGAFVLYDFTGRLVMQEAWKGGQKELQLNSGMYLLTILDDNKTLVSRTVIVR